MFRFDKKKHKIIRDTEVWGEYAYTYHERHKQEEKARSFIKGHKNADANT